MEYNIPRAFSASQGPPFFEDAMQDPSHLYPQEPYTVRTAWMETIDPMLRARSLQRQEISPSSPMPFRQEPFPLQRFMSQEESNVLFRSSGPMQNFFPQGMNRMVVPVQPFPQPSYGQNQRLNSPVSSHELSTAPSSAQSLEDDPEWLTEAQYSPMVHPRDQHYIPQATSHTGRGFPEQWTAQQNYTQQQQNGLPCVNMSQIQCLPDLEETFEVADEGFIAMDVKHEYIMEVAADMRHNHTACTYPIDEGIGASIKDEGSPLEIIAVNPYPDIDAEGELDEDLEPNNIPSPASDTEYHPRSRSTRTRKRSCLPQSKAHKGSRVQKSKSKSVAALTCKQCSHLSFKEASSLARHVSTAHTRAFTCVFDFAGCTSTFASKNEWKRHVSSQHLNLTAWVCELGTCATPKTRPSEFNRKDLFTQHLRRMHTPSSLNKNNKKDVEWEERVRVLQKEYEVVKREAPEKLGCPVLGCGNYFEGAGAWDDRMEHVGKHLEKEGDGDGEVLRQDNDTLFIEWARSESIIEVGKGGRWVLCVGGKERMHDDGEVDAEGEDDY